MLSINANTRIRCMRAACAVRKWQCLTAPYGFACKYLSLDIIFHHGFDKVNIEQSKTCRALRTLKFNAIFCLLLILFIFCSFCCRFCHAVSMCTHRIRNSICLNAIFLGGEKPCNSRVAKKQGRMWFQWMIFSSPRQTSALRRHRFTCTYTNPFPRFQALIDVVLIQ